MIQILIINDESSNKTELVINEKFKDNSNIEFYNKENRKWGSVVNFVKNNNLAKNEIVVVLDSDDFYTKNSLKIINNKIKDADIFMGSLGYYDGEKERTRYFPFIFLWDLLCLSLKEK